MRDVPTSLAIPTLSMAEVCREQRRLAYRAPATALATNMHLYWMGVAADLYRLGDASLQWMLAVVGQRRHDPPRHSGPAGESGPGVRRPQRPSDEPVFGDGQDPR